MELASAKISIGGRKDDNGSGFQAINPANQNLAADGSRDQLDEAFVAAVPVQPAWAADEDHADRSNGAPATIADVLRRNSDELTVLLTQEQGKTVANSKLEIEGADDWYDCFAELDIPSTRDRRSLGDAGRDERGYPRAPDRHYRGDHTEC